MSQTIPGLQPTNGMTAALTRAPAPAPTPDAGPPDMSDRYNTPLSAEDEAAYQAWGQQQAAQNGGRNPAADTFDYDMRGFWKSGEQFAANGHAGDTFKKPNHPTFSTFSKYSGVDGHMGGTWAGGQDGKPWTFTPSPTNLQMNDAGDLQRYFQDVEKGNQLILPQGPPQPSAAVQASPAPTPQAAPPAVQALPVPPIQPNAAPVPVPPPGSAQLLRQLR